MTGDRRPRVLLVLGTSTGGVGEHVRSLVRGLASSGHDVIVAGPEPTNDLFDFRGNGATFEALDVGSVPHPLRDARSVRRLRDHVRHVDVMHAHGLRAASLSALVAHRTPFVVTWHNAVLTSGLAARAARGLERFVAHRASVSLCASTDLLRHIVALGGVDVRLGPVAAPPRTQSRTREEVRREFGAGDRPIVLSVARLHPQKSLDTVVLAAARWRERTPQPLVLIAGSGPERERLQDLIRAHDAPVELLGRRDDVPDLIAACDLAVVSSKWEARQLFAQEVLAGHRPLVATAVGGIPELVRDGALLIPADDVGALDAAVVGLLDDPDQARALAARGEHVASHWPSEGDTVAQLVALYAELSDLR